MPALDELHTMDINSLDTRNVASVNITPFGIGKVPQSSPKYQSTSPDPKVRSVGWDRALHHPLPVLEVLLACRLD